jgi:hypothetical protein
MTRFHPAEELPTTWGVPGVTTVFAGQGCTRMWEYKRYDPHTAPKWHNGVGRLDCHRVLIMKQPVPYWVHILDGD